MNNELGIKNQGRCDEKLGTGKYGYRMCERLYEEATSRQVAAEDETEVNVVFPVGYLLQLEYTIYTIYQGSATRPIWQYDISEVTN